MPEQEAPAVFDLSQVKPIESSVAPVKPIKPKCNRQPYHRFVDRYDPDTKQTRQIIDKINVALRADIDPTRPLYSEFYVNENGKRVYEEDKIFLTEYGTEIQNKGEVIFQEATNTLWRELAERKNVREANRIFGERIKGIHVVTNSESQRTIAGRPDVAPDPIRYPGPPDLSKSVPPPLNGEITSQLRSLCRICQGTLLGVDPIPHDCSQNQF